MAGLFLHETAMSVIQLLLALPLQQIIYEVFEFISIGNPNWQSYGSEVARCGSVMVL